ncbi:hypothetical protein BKA62DRAFT_764205 [Auriculariales sp. MPI-PUGE-AT-0066]|nr:hypothetical protein BKA62DRAFT_764205 [Auriculariales sp. MPI-PUGE-AT-0066]
MHIPYLDEREHRPRGWELFNLDQEKDSENDALREAPSAFQSRTRWQRLLSFGHVRSGSEPSPPMPERREFTLNLPISGKVTVGDGVCQSVLCQIFDLDKNNGKNDGKSNDKGGDGKDSSNSGNSDGNSEDNSGKGNSGKDNSGKNNSGKGSSSGVSQNTPTETPSNSLSTGPAPPQGTPPVASSTRPSPESPPLPSGTSTKPIQTPSEPPKSTSQQSVPTSSDNASVSTTSSATVPAYNSYTPVIITLEPGGEPSNGNPYDGPYVSPNGPAASQTDNGQLQSGGGKHDRRIVAAAAIATILSFLFVCVLVAFFLLRRTRRRRRKRDSATRLIQEDEACGEPSRMRQTIGSWRTFVSPLTLPSILGRASSSVRYSNEQVSPGLDSFRVGASSPLPSIDGMPTTPGLVLTAEMNGVPEATAFPGPQSSYSIRSVPTDGIGNCLRPTTPITPSFTQRITSSAFGSHHSNTSSQLAVPRISRSPERRLSLVAHLPPDHSPFTSDEVSQEHKLYLRPTSDAYSLSIAGETSSLGRPSTQQTSALHSFNVTGSSIALETRVPTRAYAHTRRSSISDESFAPRKRFSNALSGAPSDESFTATRRSSLAYPDSVPSGESQRIQPSNMSTKSKMRAKKVPARRSSKKSAYSGSDSGSVSGSGSASAPGSGPGGVAGDEYSFSIPGGSSPASSTKGGARDDRSDMHSNSGTNSDSGSGARLDKPTPAFSRSSWAFSV